jgi:TetR/AcrR family transcriptional regulator, regulator of biofilm formation and stress response
MSRTATAGAPGRSEHGAERRAAIIGATVRLLTREGLGAVTHRAVAREAEVPLAATTYYFSSKDELIAEALRMLVADEVALLTARAAELGEAIGSIGELAQALAAAVFPTGEAERRVLLAKFEVYLAAARTPGLRPAVAEWRGTFIGLAESALAAAGHPRPGETAPVLVAAIDGVLTHALAEGLEADSDERTRERLAELVEHLAAPA